MSVPANHALQLHRLILQQLHADKLTQAAGYAFANRWLDQHGYPPRKAGGK